VLPTPGQPDTYAGSGAGDYHPGAPVGPFERRQRRQERAALRAALLARPPSGTGSVAWANASTHEDAAVEAVVRAAAGRLVRLSLPTDSPWRNPIARRWRHFRREGTHCACFATKQALLAAATDFFARHDQQSHTILSVIGSNARKGI
jgi:hypothetical protein